MTKALEISDANFDQEVKESSMPVLVNFCAPWCSYCKNLSSIIEDIAVEYEGVVKVVKINVDENPIKTAEFNIKTVPAIMLFVNGQLKEAFIPTRRKSELKTIINKYAA